MCTRQNCINRQLVITIKPRRKGNVQPQYLPKEEKKGVGKSWSAQTGLVSDDLPYLCSLYHLHKIYIQISIYLYTDMYIDKYTNAQIQKIRPLKYTDRLHCGRLTLCVLSLSTCTTKAGSQLFFPFDSVRWFPLTLDKFS